MRAAPSSATRRATRGSTQLGDAEIEQLGQEPAGAREHHDVGRLEIAVDDALLVRGVHDLADALERTARSARAAARPARQQLLERRAAHQLHRDPEDAVGLGAERVDVRRVRMVEPRREPRLAQEALNRLLGGAMIRAQDLDHRLALEQRLLGAIDAPKPLPHLLAHHEVAEGPAYQPVDTAHRVILSRPPWSRNARHSSARPRHSSRSGRCRRCPTCSRGA